MENELLLHSSVWERISEILTASELDELKANISETVVEEVEDLHQEVIQLHGIWKSLEEQENDTNDGDIICSLPEPPQMRDNIHKEINIFLDLLSQKKNQSSIDILKEFIGETDVAYFLDVDGSNHEVAVTEENLKLTSVNIETLHNVALNGDVERLRDITAKTRELLTIEKESLLNDVDHLQKRIFQTHENRGNLIHPRSKPSIQELRKIATTLEHEVLRMTSSNLTNATPEGKGSVASKEARKRLCISAPARHVPSPPISSPPSGVSLYTKSRHRLLHDRANSVPALKTKLLPISDKQQIQAQHGRDKGLHAKETLPKIIGKEKA